MKNVPNILSTLRIVLAPVFLFLYVQDEIVYQALSIAVFAVAAMTDFFDGYIAREFNVGSKLGNFLDPLADKILTFTGFIALPLASPSVYATLPIVLIIMRDVFVTALRMLAEKRNQTLQTRKSAKLKTLVQMVFLYVALLAGIFMQTEVFPADLSLWLTESGVLTWALYIVSAITVLTGIEYTVVNSHLFRRTHVANV